MVPPGSGTAFRRSISEANWLVDPLVGRLLLRCRGLWPMLCQPRLAAGTHLNEMFDPLASAPASVATRVTSQRSAETIRSSDSFISVG